MIKYILFDVAGTLIHKPTLFPKIQNTLKQYGYTVTLEELMLKHKILSEVIHFPDRTNKDFYLHFNAELLYSLGILPQKTIVENLFEACSYLPWEKFEDATVLEKLELPMGVLSNFNNTLRVKIQTFFGDIFSDIIVSEELGVAKPQFAFFEKAIESVGHAAEEILYIGDSLKLDIFPAQQLGMQTLLIDRYSFFPLYQSRIEALTALHELPILELC